MSDARPNLFIVGAPKCGTTSLYEYLRVHPDVFFPHDDSAFSRTKEPNHFCPELEIRPKHAITDRDEYFALYADAGRQRWRGDASTSHLHSTQAAANIRAACPDARILIMLRPPLDFMRSYHSELLRHDHEDIADFHTAVDASADRAAGRRIPPRSGVPRNLDYHAMARFAPQVARYFEVFGRDRVRVILLEDLVADTADTYAGVLDFLGIDARFRPEFRVHNEAPATGTIERSLKRIYANPAVQGVVKALLPYEARRRVLLRLRKADAARVDADPRDAALRASCRDDIDALATLIGRDLRHWH